MNLFFKLSVQVLPNTIAYLQRLLQIKKAADFNSAALMYNCCCYLPYQGYVTLFCKLATTSCSAFYYINVDTHWLWFIFKLTIPTLVYI